MEDYKKVYEEPILPETAEDLSKYRIWLNDILEDESIPYKTEIRKVNNSVVGIMFDYDMILEFYVYENDYNHVIELIDEYNQSNILENCEELNVSEEELGYTEDDIW